MVHKGHRNIPSAPPSSSSIHTTSVQLAEDTPSWFVPFFNHYTTFSGDMRSGLGILQEKVTSIETHYSQIDKWVEKIEQQLASSSKGKSPMSISSATSSEDESREQEEGEDDSDQEEGQNESEEQEKEDESENMEASD
ncbi:uncharacterized protein LOC131143855 [Malania oleifera]|uniref:uncharacterized protein LOC131143855 n=1 Tax=Malania oleifera TaxID=397392 RepID=UPI0025ADB868|nr:uncharacterized protein LOC131143855 [Malania oleifera]